MVESYTDFLLPPFAKYLRKYSSEWRRTDVGGVVMIPKEGFTFDSILIKSKRLPWSADKTWLFIASVTVFNSQAFSTENVQTYQKLKGYECELKKSGLVSKKFKFVNAPILARLKAEIPELKIQNTLMTFLEENHRSNEIISKINPEILSIKLFHPPIKTQDLEEYVNVYKEIYQTPTDIVWNISIEKYLGDILSKKNYSQKLDFIIELLEIISETTRRITFRENAI